MPTEAAFSMGTVGDDYNPVNGMIIVDYALPAPDAIPRVKEVKYVKSRDEFVEATVSDSEANRRYDSLLYQICLRVVHELLEADTIDARSHSLRSTSLGWMGACKDCGFRRRRSPAFRLLSRQGHSGSSRN